MNRIAGPRRLQRRETVAQVCCKLACLNEPQRLEFCTLRASRFRALFRAPQVGLITVLLFMKSA